ncbi:DNA repair protein RecO [Psychrobacter fozii]|uniref:DNA repair protein RecO n=1 Tax=Psychrobacter fozii TaxID=198480 RepID=A0A2V4VEP5_9GAMM|nr:DNA repair protein RecO C-terminal domain-containing protein [Psychrobacter fozii]PYE40748.1 DNA replication and repair protein RecO [Psychrobacter fozii]
MRNEALVGYLLHQRPYQEKRALYYLFSQQHGVIHGIGKKGAPLFMPLQLFATGKRDLKTFSQINITSQNIISTGTAEKDDIATTLESVPYGNITGQQQYSALYLNEILWRLLPTEDPMPILWQHYQDSLHQLRQPLDTDELRLCLRQFESHLFNELGFSLILTHDSVQDIIEPDCSYCFLPDVGFMAVLQNESQSEHLENTTMKTVFMGADLIKMAELGITKTTLNHWSKLYRHLIDHLLDYQPLQSRLLWQQQQRYQ